MKRATLLNKLIFGHDCPDNLTNLNLWNECNKKRLITSDGNQWTANGPIWDREEVKKLSDREKLWLITKLIADNSKWFDISDVDPDE